MHKVEPVQPVKGAKKKPEGRSPSYPGIPLSEAIGRARTMYENDGRNAAPVSAIVAHWNYKPGSGPGLIALAALKKFGLISDEGSGTSRRAKLTDLALRIILDERDDSPDREAAIKEAALRPAIHAELWNQFNGVIPSDGTLRHELLVERKFTRSGADEFIQQFRSTIAFAKLKDSPNIPLPGQDKRDETGGSSPHKVTKPKENNHMPGIREDAFTLDEGPAILTWPGQISQESANDLEAWLKLIIKKAKRLGGVPVEPEKEELESTD